MPERNKVEMRIATFILNIIASSLHLSQ